ncbi:MAG: hypothetical protein H0T46_07685 [Deltaproteobacteria bacterium]|nr:hypothetical protein [Deltaproteobacteria bacterium]
MTPTTDEDLKEMGKQLPYERPDRSRTEAVRGNLMSAAAVPEPARPRRWLLLGSGFAAGALCAAVATALLVVQPRERVQGPEAVQVYSGTAMVKSEKWLGSTGDGFEQLVVLHSGTSRVVVPKDSPRNRTHVTTSNADIEGPGEWEVVVEQERLVSLKVTSGIATLRINGQGQRVFLSAGQTWTAPVTTADLTPELSPAIVANADSTPPSTAPRGSLPGEPMPDSAATNATVNPRANADDASTTLKPRTSTTSPSAPRTPTPRVASQRTTASGAPIETEIDRKAPTAPESASAQREERIVQTEVSADRAPRPAVTAPSENLSTGEPARPATPATSPASETERHFRAGWSLLRANKLADAIVELDAAARGEGPLAADARYYQAVALIRAKRGAEAERALVQFLDNAPTSTRRGRAAIMLGRLIADRGDAAGAKAWFELAARDADPTVAAAGKAALK